MKSFSFSSLLLGLGLGLLLSAIFLSLVYKDLPMDTSKISDEYIIEKARGLGMVDPTEGFNKDNIKIHE